MPQASLILNIIYGNVWSSRVSKRKLNLKLIVGYGIVLVLILMLVRVIPLSFKPAGCIKTKHYSLLMGQLSEYNDKKPVEPANNAGICTGSGYYVLNLL